MSKSLFLAIIIITLAVPVRLFPVAAATQESVPHQTLAGESLPTVPVALAPSSAPLAATARGRCDMGTATVPNWVQDAGAINLNQPADCFSLQNTQLSVQTRLNVGLARPASRIVVSQPARTMTSYQHSGFPEPQSDPLLPYFGLLVVIVASKRALGSLPSKWPQIKQTLVSALTLSQLQIRRC